ncbi:MAG: rhamnulokinase [Gaiellales bacterium]|nr:rhamnulokinase [Gaiellales bacterium]
MTVMAAVDLGAQSGRVAVGTFDGERLVLEEAHRFANEPVRVRGTLHWDALRLYQDTLDGLRKASRNARLDSVAVDSWAVDFGLIDRAGRLLQNPVHYRDSRRSAAVEGVLARVPARELYGRTGIQLLSINTVFELAAMAAESDPALGAADTLLLIPDLFHYWLCGSRTVEYTNATTTQCLDAATGEWAVDLLDRLAIPHGLLPEVVAPATRLGAVSRDVADATGLDGVTVVAAATHDTAAAVAGVPFSGPDAAFLSVGTWSLVGLESERAFITDDTFAANLTNEGGVAETFRVLRNVTGLWLLDECRRAWAHAGRDHAYEQLVALARSAPPLGSLIDPNDPSFSEPGDMPGRIAEYCRRTGQPIPEGDGAMVRCILESLALAHAESVDLLEHVTGVRLDRLHIVGGGSRNALLCEWTAEAARRPVLAGPEEATLVGNLLVQAMAMGELSSLGEAREVARRSFVPTTYEPSESHQWSDAQARFSGLTAKGHEVEVGS